VKSSNSPILAPSILAADHAELCRGLQAVAEAHNSWVHLDIMDGHFVPNLSFGPGTVQALRQRDGQLFFDTHLMLSRPDQYIEAFTDAGSQQITIHIEPEYDVAGTLRDIKQRGLKCGLALNPGTEAAAVKDLLPLVDLVLVMTVWPGFGGQSFIEDTLPKMQQLSQWRTEKNYHFRLEVDGGINLETGRRCFEAGADTFVAGTAFFKADDSDAFRREFESF